MTVRVPSLVACLVVLSGICVAEEQAPKLPQAFIDGTGPGWQELTLDDFEHVNCDPETWSMKDGMIECTGEPVGVVRSKKKYTNLELVAEWRHLKPAGNSGIFLWASDEALTDLPRGKLPPGGIEVQILDLGYTAAYQERTGKKPDWFSCHGDIFPVGTSKMEPFPPVSPNGQRSFPREERSRGAGEWNHYYVRAINGEVRLWVNGAEVSGGKNCQPASGYMCLESEGSPIEFRHLRVRELP